jgi:hypothetical protein
MLKGENGQNHKADNDEETQPSKKNREPIGSKRPRAKQPVAKIHEAVGDR